MALLREKEAGEGETEKVHVGLEDAGRERSDRSRDRPEGHGVREPVDEQRWEAGWRADPRAWCWSA